MMSESKDSWAVGGTQGNGFGDQGDMGSSKEFFSLESDDPCFIDHPQHNNTQAHAYICNINEGMQSQGVYSECSELPSRSDGCSGIVEPQEKPIHAHEPKEKAECVQVAQESDEFLGISKISLDAEQLASASAQMEDHGNPMEVEDMDSSVAHKEIDSSNPQDVKIGAEDEQIEQFGKSLEENPSNESAQSGHQLRKELIKMVSHKEVIPESFDDGNRGNSTVRNQQLQGIGNQSSGTGLGYPANMVSSDSGTVSEDDTSEDEDDDSTVSSSEDESEEENVVKNNPHKVEQKQNSKTVLDKSVASMLSPYLQYLTDDDPSDDEQDLSEGLAVAMVEDSADGIAKGVRGSKRGDEESSEEDGNDVPRTKNEVLAAPPVPKVEAVLAPHHKLLCLGSVSSVVDSIVIVEGHEIHQALNEGSILWLMEQKSPLGYVDEIFGPVKKPFYSVRFNLPEDVPREAKPGVSVAFVPEFSIRVHDDPELYRKGYDASGNNDEELPDEEWEFSDDEKESEFKRHRAASKRQNSARKGDSANAIIPQANVKQCILKASDYVSEKKQGKEFGRASINSFKSHVKKEQGRARKQKFSGARALEGDAQQISPHKSDKAGSSCGSYHSPSYLVDISCNKNSQQSFSPPHSHLMGKEPVSPATSMGHRICPRQCTPGPFSGPATPKPHSGSDESSPWNYCKFQDVSSLGFASESRSSVAPCQRPQPQPEFASTRGSESGLQFGMIHMQAGHEHFPAARVLPGNMHSPGPNQVPMFRSPCLRYPVDTPQSQGGMVNEYVMPPHFDLQANTVGRPHPSHYNQAIVSMATLGVEANTYNSKPPVQGASNLQLPPMARPPLLPQLQLQPHELHPPAFPARPDIMHPQSPQLHMPAFMTRPENFQRAVSRGFYEPNTQANQQGAQQQQYNGAVYHQGCLPEPSSQWSLGKTFAPQMEFTHPHFHESSFQGLHAIGIPVPGNIINMGNASYPLPPLQSNHLGDISTNSLFTPQVHGPRFPVRRPS